MEIKNTKTPIVIGNMTDVGNKNKNTTNLVNNKNKTTINYYNYKINENTQNKINRPGLQHIGEGKIITFEAIVVGSYNKFKDCVTIVNIHSNDKFLADHTQLFLNEPLSDFNERNEFMSCLIQGIGKIKKYPKNNSFDYSIELLSDHKVVFLNDLYYNSDYMECYDINEINKCHKILLTYKHNDLIRFLNHLRSRINNFPRGFFRKDFIYHYILNNYGLNTINSDIFENNIQSNQFDDFELYDLIILLGNVLYEFIMNREFYLDELLRTITMDINAIQGIKSLSKYPNKQQCKKSNNDFANFCKKRNIKFGLGWLFVRNRNKNFKISETMSLDEVRKKGLVGLWYTK